MNEFNIPTRHNQKLQTVVKRINADEELWQLWRCANVNAMDRSGITDHGEIHIRVVANAALKMLRLLTDAGVQTSIEADYEMTKEDAEVVVVLAACLHDLGISIHRDDHEQYSLFLARGKLPYFLDGLYDIRERTIMISETLHAMIAHRWDVRCLTLEAGVMKVADALDMTEGRSRGGVHQHPLGVGGGHQQGRTQARRRATHPGGDHHEQLGRRLPGGRAAQAQAQELQHCPLRGGNGPRGGRRCGEAVVGCIYVVGWG